MRQDLLYGFDIKEIFVVDDGSNDATLDNLKPYQAKLPLKGIRLPYNQGKGHAVHIGLMAATADWCLVADADSATPWNQLERLFTSLKIAQAQMAIGSRGLPENYVKREQTWIRKNMGITFNAIVRLITGLPFRDTQCGFKLISRAHVQSFLPDLKIRRFAWDVEFLMFAQNTGLKIIEVPVEWEHQDASRVRIIHDSIEMLFQVVLLRIRLILRQVRTPDQNSE